METPKHGKMHTKPHSSSYFLILFGKTTGKMDGKLCFHLHWYSVFSHVLSRWLTPYSLIIPYIPYSKGAYSTRAICVISSWVIFSAVATQLVFPEFSPPAHPQTTRHGAGRLPVPAKPCGSKRSTRRSTIFIYNDPCEPEINLKHRVVCDKPELHLIYSNIRSFSMLRSSLIQPPFLPTFRSPPASSFLGPSASRSSRAQPLEPPHPNRSREGWNSGASAPSEKMVVKCCQHPQFAVEKIGKA